MLHYVHKQQQTEGVQDMTEKDYINKWIAQTEKRIKTLYMMMEANIGTSKFDWIASMHSKEKLALNQLKRERNIAEL